MTRVPASFHRLGEGSAPAEPGSTGRPEKTRQEPRPPNPRPPRRMKRSCLINEGDLSIAGMCGSCTTRPTRRPSAAWPGANRAGRANRGARGPGTEGRRMTEGPTGSERSIDAAGVGPGAKTPDFVLACRAMGGARFSRVCESASYSGDTCCMTARSAYDGSICARRCPSSNSGRDCVRARGSGGAGSGTPPDIRPS